MKILFTGFSGMLGAALGWRLMEFGEVIGVSRRGKSKAGGDSKIRQIFEADVGDPQVVERLQGIGADLVVHAAAFTDVDGCETDPEEAVRVNSNGCGHIAQLCRIWNAPLVSISTDYVFEGSSNVPYRETDPTGPISVYGASKLFGEEKILKTAPRWVIVRSGWIYGPGGKNFVEQIVRRAKEGEGLKVVNDQRGSPTYTEDLAQGLVALIRQWEASGYSQEKGGVYHLVNGGACSRWELAVKAVELSGFRALITPVPSSGFPRPAKRPGNSALATDRYTRFVGKPLRMWGAALGDYCLRLRRDLSCAS